MQTDFELNWNVEPINGQAYFFSEDNFKKYSIEESFEERFLSYLTRLDGKPAVGCASDKNTKNCSSLSSNNKKGEVHIAQRQTPKTTNLKELSSNSPNQRLSSKLSHSLLHGKKSSLSLEEQSQYLFLFEKYGLQIPADPTEEERAELRKLQGLQDKVKNEQKEFLEITRKIALSSETEYNFLHNEAKKHAQLKNNKKKKEVELYPKFYNNVKEFKLAGVGVSPSLVLQRVLANLGNPSRMLVPSVQNGRQMLSVNLSAIQEVFPVEKSLLSVEQRNTQWNHTACSFDPNAEILARTYLAHIVISPGALKCLVNNHAPEFKRDWNIPFTVKDYVIPGENVLHRVVYIDHPLLTKNQTGRDLNTNFFRLVMKFNMAKSFTKTEPRKSQKQNTQKNDSTGRGISNSDQCFNTDTGLFDSSEVMEDLETFGTISADKHESMEAIANKKVANMCAKPLKTEKDLSIQTTTGETQKESLDVCTPATKWEMKEDLLKSKIITTRQSNCDEHSFEKEKNPQNSVNVLSYADIKTEEKTSEDVPAPFKEKPSRSRRDTSGSEQDSDALYIDEESLNTSKEDSELKIVCDDIQMENEMLNPESPTPRPISPESPNGSGRVCSPDLRKCVVIPLEDENEVVMDRTSCQVRLGLSPKKKTPPKSRLAESSHRYNTRAQRSNTSSETSVLESERSDILQRLTTSLIQTPFREQSETDKNSPISKKMGKNESGTCKPDPNVLTSPKRSLSLDNDTTVQTRRRTRQSLSRQQSSNDTHTATHEGLKETSPSYGLRSTRRKRSHSTKSEDHSPRDQAKMKSQDKMADSSSTGDGLNEVTNTAPSTRKRTRSTTAQENGTQSSSIGSTAKLAVRHEDSCKPVTHSRNVAAKEKTSSQKSVNNNTTLDTILHGMDSTLIQPHHKATSLEQGNGQTKEELNLLKPGEEENVSYSLWKLGDFQLLIRCSTHGVVKRFGQQVQPVHVIPKMEYQSMHGMEKLTPEEVATTWISACIRPNCHMIRCRINPLSSELLSLEDVNIAHMLNANKREFSPQNSLLMLQNIFCQLHQQTPGKYLLNHTAGSDEVLVKKATDNNKRAPYDLHFEYFGFAAGEYQKSSDIAWIPIDTDYITPTHLKNKRIPATFEPQDYHAPVQNKKKQRKGRKGKKK